MAWVVRLRISECLLTISLRVVHPPVVPFIARRCDLPFEERSVEFLLCLGVDATDLGVDYWVEHIVLLFSLTGADLLL
jgi:hypothetical protein